MSATPAASVPPAAPAPIVSSRTAARVALLIAWRYLFARSHGYATFVNWVSFFGLLLGVMILTVVVSVMNGFDREISQRVLSIVPHALITPAQPATFDAGPLIAVAGVAGVSRFYQAEAMLVHRAGVDFVALAAFDAEGFRHTLSLGGEPLEALSKRGGGVLLGRALAAARGLSVGDSVTLVLAAPSAAGARPRVQHFQLAGTFETGADPDTALVVAQRSEIVRRGLVDSGLDAWRLHLQRPAVAAELVPEVYAALGQQAATVRFWMDDYGELFRAVKIEKAMMFALLALIVAIASFNIVSGQAMLVNDKRRDIAMLTTIGSARGLLIAVFFLQGFVVAFFAVATGLAAGVVVALNAGTLAGALAAATGFSIVDGTWFAEVPSSVQAMDLAIIGALSLGLSLLAVLVPAFKATATNPADALHGA